MKRVYTEAPFAKPVQQRPLLEQGRGDPSGLYWCRTSLNLLKRE